MLLFCSAQPHRPVQGVEAAHLADGGELLQSGQRSCQARGEGKIRTVVGAWVAARLAR
jgi:hypothetical protein